MPLPPLYLEGLAQHARRAPDELNVYKLGLIEVILKEALRAEDDRDSARLRSAMQNALEVARWEMRRDRGAVTSTDSVP